MTRSVFRIGSWAALIAGILTAISAAIVVVVGTLALAGKVTYPVDIGLGPVSIQGGVSVPVASGADVCQAASVLEQGVPRDCLRFFVHDDNGSGNDAVRVQDADVRPISATLTGKVELATTGGWNGLVAVSVARSAVDLVVITGVLLLLSRLLAHSAAGAAFSARAVRYVRGIGWLLIVGCVSDAVLGFFTGLSRWGYSVEAFGAGPHLAPIGGGGIEFAQLALGGLVLILAEVFRHGAAVEGERRLTV